MKPAPAQLYEFDNFRVDPVKRLLRRRDGTTVPLTPRVFDTLLCLVEQHDTVLDKERLMEAVWPDSIVEENNLTQNISTLRRVFGESPGAHRFIVTVPGRGYRFVAAVKTLDPEGVDTAVSNGEKPERELRHVPPVAPPSFPASSHVAPAPIRGPRFPAKFGLALLIIALAGAGLLLWRKYSPPPTAVQSDDALIPTKSIAVLPFESLSADPDNAFFAAGVQDEILSNLAKMADLKVISRTSANLYKTGAPRNIREIGQQLGVAHLLEGSVQRDGNRVRIHAQLIDTRNDSHLWAQSYDREVSDVFAIQTQIAETIADQLHVKISASERAAVALPLTRDLVAKDLYLRATSDRATDNGIQGLQRQIGYLEQAIARDPSFVQAYCALARAHVDLYSNGYDHTPAHLDRIRETIDKAAALQPDSGAVHLTRAHYLARGRRDYDATRTELELARRVLPNDAFLHYEIGLTDRRQGRWSEAIGNFDRTVELDPLNSTYLLEACNSYAAVRRYPEANRLARRALGVAPRNPAVRMMVAYLDFAERADLTRLRAELDALLAENLGGGSDIADDLFFCALFERDPAALQRALAVLPPEGVSGAADTVWPREWYVAVAAQFSGKAEAAREAFSATRSILEKILREQPGYPSAWSLLGRVEAALGNKDAAINAGKRGTELLPLTREPTSGLKPLCDLARIYVAVGEKDLALEILEAHAAQTIFTDYGHLKLEPTWDPIRDDPRFQKVLASLAPK